MIRFPSVGEPPLVVAELACAHQGSVERAKALIDAARGAAVDAVQLQVFRAAANMVPQESLFRTIEGLEFSDAAWGEQFEYAHRVGLPVLVFVYDVPSFHLAERFTPAGYKLCSSDLCNPELLALLAASGRPVTVGTGASTGTEIERAVSGLRGNELVLMHGIQSFPTAASDAQLNRLNWLKERFQLPIGYADHSPGGSEEAWTVDMMALALGACVLEKHVTLDRSEKGVDYEAALEPQELRSFVDRARSYAAALGATNDGTGTEVAERYRRFQKKVAVASRPLVPGRKLERDDIRFLRCSEGRLDPFDALQLVGRVIRADVGTLKPLSPDQFHGLEHVPVGAR